MPVINVRGSTFRDTSGAVYYRYRSDVAPNGNYASGDFRIKTKQGVVEYTEEQAYQKALAASYSYLGIDPAREIESYNESVDRENKERASIEALHKRREGLRQGFGGRFSDIAIQDVTRYPGEYLPSYIQKLPQAQAESMIKAGKIGGWKVGDRYFRTQQEANEYINRDKITTITQQNKPWRPSLYPDIQASKDIKKKFDDKYEPYVTIEGTTLYKSKGQPESVTVPRFGKMVPAKEDPAIKFISENFEKGERFVSDKLMLHEILNPVIRAVESYKPAKYTPTFSSFTGQEWKDVSLGALTGVRDKPLTIAGNIAATILITKGLGSLPKLAGVTGGLGTGAVASKISAVNLLGVGLAGMYGYDVAGRYSQASNKGRFVGEVAATEVVPFAVGGYIGTKPIPKISLPKLSNRVQLKNIMSVRKKLTLDESTGKLWKEPTPEFIEAQYKLNNILNPTTGRQPVKIKSISGYKEQKPKSEWWKEPTPEFIEAQYKAHDILRNGDIKTLSEYVKEPIQSVKPKIIRKASKPSIPKLPKKLDVAPLTIKVTKKHDLTSIIKERQKARMDKYNEQMKSGGYTITKQGQILILEQKHVVQKSKLKTIKKETTSVKTKQSTVKIKEQAQAQKTATKLKTIFPIVNVNKFLEAATKQRILLNTILKQETVVIPKTRTDTILRLVPTQTSRQITSQAAIQKSEAKSITQQKSKQIEKQISKTQQKSKQITPEKIKLLSLNKFKSQLNDYVRKRKRKGKHIWDVNNPVPTLRSLTG